MYLKHSGIGGNIFLAVLWVWIKILPSIEFSRKYTKFAILSFFCCLRTEKKNNFSKSYPQKGLNLGPLVIHSDGFLTELTWQMLVGGYSRLLVHQFNFVLR